MVRTVPNTEPMAGESLDAVDIGEQGLAGDLISLKASCFEAISLHRCLSRLGHL